MTVLEYLQRKYNKENPHILQIESYIFKIPYPIKTGQFKHYGSKKITQHMAHELITHFKNYKNHLVELNLLLRFYLKSLVIQNQVMQSHQKQSNTHRIQLNRQPKNR
jgi:hypothetical protein